MEFSILDFLKEWSAPIILIGGGSLIWKAGGWKKTVDFRLNKLDESLARVERGFDEIRLDIKDIFSRLPATSVKGSSPLTLTELGEQISNEVGAKKWAEQIAEELQESVKNMEPFEIQDICFDYVKEKFQPEPEFLKLLQTSAYNTGLDLKKVYDVLAVELRDHLLEI